jgi:hypothetical protein
LYPPVLHRRSKYLPRHAKRGHIDIPVRVRPLGLIGVSLVLGASLLQTSIPADARRSDSVQRLNFRLDPLDVESPPPAPQVAPTLWAASRPLPTGKTIPESARHAPVLLPDGVDAVALELTLGAKEPVAVVTNAPTVADLLDVLEIRLEQLDVVKPGGSRRLWPGIDVRVIRIREVVRKTVVATPFQTLIRYSKDLVVGTMRTLEEGQVGRAVRTYFIRFRNGREVRRELLSERIVFEPRNEVVLKGTVQPATTGSHRQVGQASWYDFCPVWGMYAAHLTIPKGTLVHVRNLDNGKAVDVVINDSGPYGVPGRIIDLCQPAFAAIAPLGQGVADVEITW